MDSITQLLAWASTTGIILNGIEPKILPGRGIGLVSTRAIKVDETILSVPNHLLRRLDNTPKSIQDALPGATVHSILATSLAFDLANPPSQDFTIWKDVFPSRSDISTSIPLCWPSNLQALLPQSGKDLLKSQRANFDRDWSPVSSAYPSLSREDYIYAWLLVNTRTFYHTTPKTKKDLPKEDHMVLQPVADLFNHSPDGCSVGFSYEGFTIITTSEAKKGEEMFIRYGSHSNDFLLVEYGFILGRGMNSFDEVALDEYILPKLSNRERGMLEDRGFLGKYMLDAETVCYRTQVALRAMVLEEGLWLDFLDGRRGEDADQRLVDEILLKALKQYKGDIEDMKEKVNDVSVGDLMRNMLRDRWQQIQGLVDAGIERIET